MVHNGTAGSAQNRIMLLILLNPCEGVSTFWLEKPIVPLLWTPCTSGAGSLPAFAQNIITSVPVLRDALRNEANYRYFDFEEI